MKTKVITSINFRKKAKPLLKKYSSLKEELLELQEELLKNSEMGTSLGNNTFKIRLGVKSKGKGVRGGLRIITYLIVRIVEKEDVKFINLATIYDKSEFENISDKELKSIISEIEEELSA